MCVCVCMCVFSLPHVTMSIWPYRKHVVYTHTTKMRSSAKILCIFRIYLALLADIWGLWSITKCFFMAICLISLFIIIVIMRSKNTWLWYGVPQALSNHPFQAYETMVCLLVCTQCPHRADEIPWWIANTVVHKTRLFISSFLLIQS